MATSVKEFRDFNQVLDFITKEYPHGDEKVSANDLRDIFTSIEKQLLFMRRIDPNKLNVMSDLYIRAKKGLPARYLHNEISNLFSGFDTEGSGRPDFAIARLERQLRDLRMMITTTTDVDKKFRDLQDQVESLREDMDGGRSLLLDKQEDMLQKFLASDKKAFIIMPFQRDFDNVWQGSIKPACLETHYAPLRVDEVNLSSLITEDIERYSTMANVVVVDLTGNNPNVMFELGWSLGKNKKPIVICQGEHTSKVAFDVRGIRHISYENSWLGVESLKKKLKEFITTTEQHMPIHKSKSEKKAKIQKDKTT